MYVSGAREAIDSFVRSARRPALLEPGEPLLSLTLDTFLVEHHSTHVLLQAWDDTRNIVRRVTAIREQTRGKLVLTVRKFANREGELLLLDLDVPAKREWKKRGDKLVFRERFRQFLQREFGGWDIVDLSVDPDLEHSLSPSFPRAYVRKSQGGIAAIAAPPEIVDASGILTFGLLWLDHLRRREPRVALERLVILLPAGHERPTTLRIPYLAKVGFAIFTYCENDRALLLDPSDFGNLDTTLDPCRRPIDANVLAKNFAVLRDIEGFERVERPDGGASLRIHGLEFAVYPGRESLSELAAHGRELSRLRQEPGSQLYRRDAERWLESRVRKNITELEASLKAAPIYGQVPAFTAGERGIIDLLAVENSGRLAVVELKASADIHLPLQSLDYWMRVAKYAREGDFTPMGYFPGVVLSTQSPKLILIAPSLEFHPSTEVILSFFSPEVEVLRIGLGAQWRKQLQVAFRLFGASPA